MWTLAQWGDPNAVRPLAATPAIERILFEEPLPLILGFCVAGVAGFIWFNQRAKLRQAIAAIVIGLAFAAAGWLASRIVTTPREAIRSAAATLVEATATGDGATLRGLVDPGVTVQSGNRDVPITLTQGVDAVVMLVNSTLGPSGRYPVQSAEIMENQATLDGPEVARSQVRVRVVQRSGSGFHTFAWVRVDWRRDGNSWKARTIEPLAVWLPGANLGSSPR